MQRDPRVRALAPALAALDLGRGDIHAARSGLVELTRSIPVPEGVEVRTVRSGGRDAVHIRPTGAPTEHRILYLHGGAFCIGDPRHQLSVPARLARATGAEVVSAELRLAPEHPCPAQTEDAVAAYRSLLADGAPVVAIAGDSSGGALAVLTTVALRDAGDPLPHGVVAFSPWTDLDGSRRRRRDAYRDPVLPDRWMGVAARAYLGGRSADDPEATPLTAHLAGLPPMSIHVGSDELLLDDALALASELGGAGVDVTTHVWPGMIHVFVAYPQLAPESDLAMAEVGRWLSGVSPG